MNEPLITLTNIKVVYKVRRSLFHAETYEPLHDINLSIHRGEKIGIIGRNGCGKSTLLRVIAGLVRPHAGTMTVAPNVRVSLLSLQLGFDPMLNGIDNIILGTLLLGFSKQQARKNLEEIIEFAELGEFIHKPVRTYSSGMKARLAFSVAITLQPDVLLIDEVLGVGDAHFRKKSSDALKSRLSSEQTFLLVSHNNPTIIDLCSQAMWIEDGRISGSGEPRALLAEYEAFRENVTRT